MIRLILFSFQSRHLAMQRFKHPDVRMSRRSNVSHQDYSKYCGSVNFYDYFWKGYALNRWKSITVWWQWASGFLK